MSDYGFRVKPFGFPAYKKKLTAMAVSLDELDIPLEEAKKVSLAAVKSYPPYGDWEHGQITAAKTRPGSKYKRTFALQRGWRARRTKTNKMLKVTVWHQHPTSRKYYPYVQGGQQTSVHKPWWVTTEEWPKKLQPVVLKIFQRYMKSIVLKFK